MCVWKKNGGIDTEKKRKRKKEKREMETATTTSSDEEQTTTHCRGRRWIVTFSQKTKPSILFSEKEVEHTTFVCVGENYTDVQHLYVEFDRPVGLEWLLRQIIQQNQGIDSRSLHSTIALASRDRCIDYCTSGKTAEWWYQHNTHRVFDT